MTGEHARHGATRRRLILPPTLEMLIFVLGLAAAATAGVIAYRIVGLYGDGPFASGYHRERDPETGGSRLVHETRTDAGIVRRVIERRQLSEVRLDLDADGTEDALVRVGGAQQGTRVERDQDGDGRTDLWEYYDEAQQLVKSGFSLAGGDAPDAWAYRDSAGQLTTIEVSTRRDDTIDRWEYYENGQLARVEADLDRDGRVDLWSIYDAGILMGTTVDANGDGEPDEAIGGR